MTAKGIYGVIVWGMGYYGLTYFQRFTCPDTKLCPECNGEGRYPAGMNSDGQVNEDCVWCGGSGKIRRKKEEATPEKFKPKKNNIVPAKHSKKPK